MLAADVVHPEHYTMEYARLLAVFLSQLFLLHSTFAVDFSFDGFSSSDLLLYGDATISSNVLSLTENTTFSMGRALFHAKVPTRFTNSSKLLPFSTSFTFSLSKLKNSLPGHGFVFIFVPSAGIQGASSSQNLGFLNRTNDGNPNGHVFGVEFDVFQNHEFNDINDNHVGVDINSLTSIVAYKAGYWFDNKTNWSFKEVRLNDGANYRVWIEYWSHNLIITLAPAYKKKPQRPLIKVPLDLSGVFLDEMYVGFSAATGQLLQNHKILSWSFNNSIF